MLLLFHFPGGETEASNKLAKAIGQDNDRVRIPNPERLFLQFLHDAREAGGDMEAGEDPGREHRPPNKVWRARTREHTHTHTNTRTERSTNKAFVNTNAISLSPTHTYTFIIAQIETA